ncbi:MAG TPA: endonuclease [Planctomycetaceae bacterium]|nr:endonuclease [Blastopirellula sp.]HAY78209.1 endonuclease [Planctomycetaceae bacterium]
MIKTLQVRHVICALTVALATWRAGSTADAAEPTTLRVLCYNIHYGQGTDGRYDVARLANVIKAAKPDLVALQEVDVGVKRSGRVHQARRLAELTNMSVRYGPTQHYQGGLYGNAVLTHLPILDVHIQPLPYTLSTGQRTTYPRGAISVTVRAPNQLPLRFISTHFQHNVPEDRLAEAKAINKFFPLTPALPSILAGDMNAVPTSAPVVELQKHWANAIDPERTPSAPSQQPKSRIDYIFYQPAQQFRLKQTEVLSESVASDHRPVLAVFELLKD